MSIVKLLGCLICVLFSPCSKTDLLGVESKGVAKEKVDQKEKEWIVFVKDFANSKLVFKIPEDPQLIYHTYNDTKLLEVKSEDRGFEYRFVVFEKPAFNINVDIMLQESELLLKKYLIATKQKKLKPIIVEFQMNKKTDRNLLDIRYKDSSNNFYRATFVITKDNIFTFFSKIKDNQEDAHQLFVESFSYGVLE